MSSEVLTVGGPRVVALGGGHGLAVSLTAARRYASRVAAVVSVADDGGSSGRLRSDLGIPPPGDVRRCLVALAAERDRWTAAFEHRFDQGELAGHVLGNLVIAGLAGSGGSFEAALEESARLLGTVGPVIPAADRPAELWAWLRAGSDGRAPDVVGPSPDVVGQVAVAARVGIARVGVGPAGVGAPRAAVDAVRRADQVVLGPGSLYTSVLAAAVVPGLRQALAETSAVKVYVCNLRADEPETKGYDVAGHVAALVDHGIVPDVVVFDGRALDVGSLTVGRLEADLAEPGAGTHDPARLAAALAHSARAD